MSLSIVIEINIEVHLHSDSDPFHFVLPPFGRMSTDLFRAVCGSLSVRERPFVVRGDAFSLQKEPESE